MYEIQSRIQEAVSAILDSEETKAAISEQALDLIFNAWRGGDFSVAEAFDRACKQVGEATVVWTVHQFVGEAIRRGLISANLEVMPPDPDNEDPVTHRVSPDSVFGEAEFIHADADHIGLTLGVSLPNRA